MDRRDFLGQTFRCAAAAGFFWTLGRHAKLLASSGALNPDLVAVKGGLPDSMFDEGIKALGGMGRFVKKGQTVLVKPNIAWNATPERAANTNPRLVRRVIEHCYNAGAKKVVVFDHTCNYWQDSYKNSGIQDAVRQAKGQLMPAHQESYYQKVDLPEAKYIKSVKVHELVLSSDVFINVPVLKHHGGARMTAGMKNLMGIVWDRGAWHATDLQRCIADFNMWRKPDLNIIDAYYVMFRNGPRGITVQDLRAEKMLLLSPDIVAVDAAAAKIFGTEPEKIPYLAQASERGLGRMDLENLNISRLTL